MTELKCLYLQFVEFIFVHYNDNDQNIFLSITLKFANTERKQRKLIVCNNY